ncbi:MAG TPA: hypothetical protein VEY94_14060, partial [Patescibacteria group bacterium]|nr:hypothetical protein [Patescibacteria group bacterium]
RHPALAQRARGGEPAQISPGMEINHLFEELTKRVESVERIHEVKWRRSKFINGTKHLPVRLTPPAQLAAAQAGLGDGFF